MNELVEVIGDKIIVEFGPIEMRAHSLTDHALVGCYDESGMLEEQEQPHGFERRDGGLGQAAVEIVDENDQCDAKLFEGRFKIIPKRLNGLSRCFFGWFGPLPVFLLVDERFPGRDALCNEILRPLDVLAGDAAVRQAAQCCHAARHEGGHRPHGEVVYRRRAREAQEAQLLHSLEQPFGLFQHRLGECVLLLDRLLDHRRCDRFHERGSCVVIVLIEPGVELDEPDVDLVPSLERVSQQLHHGGFADAPVAGNTHRKRLSASADNSLSRDFSNLREID